MSTKTKLNNLCNYFFISGFFLGKVQSLPLPIVSTFFSLLSLFCYGTGYSLWFISSHYYPNQSIEKKEWFLQFKNQQLYAAILGLIATALSISALFAPVLIIPATWSFVLSNTLWFLDEYHKVKSPPLKEKNYSHEYQKAYTAYAGLINAVSIVGALSATLIVILPVAALPIFIISGTLAVSLGALSVGILANYYLGAKNSPVLNNVSPTKMTQSLNVSSTIQEKETLKPPYHGKNILSSPNIEPVKKSDDPLTSEPSFRM